MWETLRAWGAAVAAALGFIQKRQELNNTPEMIARQEAKEDQKKSDEFDSAIANDDEDSIRNSLDR